MDFFEQQNKARRKTGLLALYFGAAILLITVAVNVAVYTVLTAGGFMKSGLNTVTHSNAGSWFDEPNWIWATLITLGIIGLGSLFSFLRLSGGGRSVARMVDARLVDLNTTDPRERRLINVVEEMSIASGTPVPELYVQDGELGINAFVAGYHIREAVLVVTEGSLANLTRDELQGVVGHEFSHILNGDMRINVRLIAVLAGIILLSQIGGFMMRSGRFARLSSRESAGATMSIFSAGILLFVLGYIGLFFGRLIKAAISRQREYLADSAAVQFTRNPDGISNALYKIKMHSEGSIIAGAHAEDMSHMCFGETMKYSFTSLFATHPPIDERISAVNPRFIPPAELSKPKDYEAESEPEQDDQMPGPAQMMGAIVTAKVLVDSVGNPSPAHIDYAQNIHRGISDDVRDSIHQPLGARAVIYAMVLCDGSDESFEGGQELVALRDGEETANAVREVVEDVRKLGSNSRLPLVELTFPALGRLHRDQKDAFVATLEKVIKFDNRFTLFEFALLTLIRKHLQVGADQANRTEYTKLDDVQSHLEVLVSLFARLGQDNDTGRHALYQRVMATFGLSDGGGDMKSANAQQLTNCLGHLDRLSPLLKRPVINACADCIVEDGVVKPTELELLRAVCAALDCPMPPLVTD